MHEKMKIELIDMCSAFIRGKGAGVKIYLIMSLSFVCPHQRTVLRRQEASIIFLAAIVI